MKKSELKKLIKEILNEGMYDGARCPDCGGLLDDEGHHRKECPAKKRSEPIRHGGSKKDAILRKLIGKGMTREKAIAWMQKKGLWESTDD